MLRIGGTVRVLITELDQAALLVDSLRPPGAQPRATPVPRHRTIGSGLVAVDVDAGVAAVADSTAGFVGGTAVTGFETLTAGLIASLEAWTAGGRTVGYLERSFGVQLTDCAVLWRGGSIDWGPAGSLSDHDQPHSAATELLAALGVDPSDWPAVLERIAHD